ncbi:acetyl-CoA carboxylase biotin carboxyl carrier protein subunit [Mucilaginibacter calamicampi]|uniref:Acetyl-CoA carboxylase biotin carboxyl carrier protein subunit n=1 Tax=Mucilaginibacter calamicampi TaxID=1302352 RepID=A0ABW2YZ10_9SPHI
MLEVTVNNAHKYTVEESADGVTTINSEKVDPDISEVGASAWHIINDLQSYNAEVVSFDSALKTAQIKINNNLYTVSAKDQFDLLLDKMGLSNLNSAKIGELKAPMPGLVLRTFVKEGDAVSKGDNLLILEAMKMENIIKSPVDAVVKAVKVSAGDKVEKGQILLSFS